MAEPLQGNMYIKLPAVYPFPEAASSEILENLNEKGDAVKNALQSFKRLTTYYPWELFDYSGSTVSVIESLKSLFIWCNLQPRPQQYTFRDLNGHLAQQRQENSGALTAEMVEKTKSHFFGFVIPTTLVDGPSPSVSRAAALYFTSVESNKRCARVFGSTDNAFTGPPVHKRVKPMDLGTLKRPDLRLGSPVLDKSQEIDNLDNDVRRSMEVIDDSESEQEATSLPSPSTPRHASAQHGPQQTPSSSKRSVTSNTNTLTTNKASPVSVDTGSEGGPSLDTRNENSSEEDNSSQEGVMETERHDSTQQITEELSGSFRSCIESVKSEIIRINATKCGTVECKRIIETLGQEIKSFSEAQVKVNESYGTTAEFLKELQRSSDSVESLGIPDVGHGLHDSMARVRATQKEHLKKYENLTMDIKDHSVARQGYQDKLKDLETRLPMLQERTAKLQDLVKDGEHLLSIISMGGASGIKQPMDKVLEMISMIRRMVRLFTGTEWLSCL